MLVYQSLPILGHFLKFKPKALLCVRCHSHITWICRELGESALALPEDTILGLRYVNGTYPLVMTYSLLLKMAHRNS